MWGWWCSLVETYSWNCSVVLSLTEKPSPWSHWSHCHVSLLLIIDKPSRCSVRSPSRCARWKCKFLIFIFHPNTTSWPSAMAFPGVSLAADLLNGISERAWEWSDKLRWGRVHAAEPPHKFRFSVFFRAFSRLRRGLQQQRLRDISFEIVSEICINFKRHLSVGKLRNFSCLKW